MAHGIKHLYDVVSAFSNQDECKSCCKCEKNVGLVYVLNEEVKTLRSRKVPLVATSGGVNYIKRSSDGWCPCYDTSNGRCKIYDVRPLCCRIYPLDIMKEEGEIWWVVFKDCPISQRFQKEKRMTLLFSKTIEIEKCLSENQIAQLIKQDRLSKAIEVFDMEEATLIKLRKFKEASQIFGVDACGEKSRENF